MSEPLTITGQIEKALEEAVREAFDVEAEGPFRLGQPPDPALGEFAFPCFPLAKTLRMAPTAIALRLEGLLAKKELFQAVKATGPYLNFMIDKPFLARFTLSRILEEPDRLGRCDAGVKEKVMIEYSAPNTNKPQHLGHIRNNVLGISLVNLLTAVGHEVVPVNLVNDRGVHICKSMLAYQRFGQGQTPEEAGRKGDHFVGDFYVLYDQEENKEREAWLEARKPIDEGGDAEALFIQQSKLYAKAQEMLKKWEAEDPATRALWEKMNAWVYEGFDSTYARLGCRFEKVYRESETYQLGKALVKEGLDRGGFLPEGGRLRLGGSRVGEAG